MVQPGIKTISVIVASAVICEGLKQAGIWEIGAKEIYDRREMVLDAVYLIPDWLYELVIEKTQAAVTRIKNCLSSSVTFVVSLFRSDS